MFRARDGSSIRVENLPNGNINIRINQPPAGYVWGDSIEVEASEDDVLEFVKLLLSSLHTKKTAMPPIEPQ